MTRPPLVHAAWAGAIACLLTGTVTVHSQAPALPTPESSFGFRPGADYKLATYEDVVAYFKTLDAASDWMRLFEAGTSTQGRTFVYAAISAPENLARLDRLRAINQRLAHPEGLSEAEARALAREGRAFVHIDGGLHASEVAGPQHTPQLAYDLLSRADEPDIALALQNVVLLLWPTINPDGQTMIAEWYRGNVGTSFEVSPMPRLYQEYVGHDNNRDGYMLNMIESRVMEHAWRAWEPQIIHVHHQTAPFPTRIWLPPFAEPIATRVPPLLSREVNMIGMAMAKGLEERGQVGATHMGTGYDAWYPGYIDYKPMLQNIASFWTETALYQYATPRFYTAQDFPADARDLRPQSLYSSPWSGGWWRLRDAVEYMETASLSVIDWAARYKESLLLNRYRAGRGQIERYRHEPPYAYVVSPLQRDPVAAVELLRRLAFQGLRVSQLTSTATIDGVAYPAGTWVVPMDQEFGEVARQVLEVQQYPDLRESPDGPLEQPYDAAGWTLPLQMGVKVAAAMTPLDAAALKALKPLGRGPDPAAPPTPYLSARADASPFDSVPGLGFDADPVAAAIVPPAGRATGNGPVLIVDPAQNNAFRAVTRTWKAGGGVRLVAAANGRGARYALTGLADGAIAELVASLGLQAERAPAATGAELRRPRVGLYRPWQASMDEGWTRWLFEQYGIEFSSVAPEDVRTGRPLRERFDVVVIADEGRGLLDGYAPGVVPPRYEGGLGLDGVRALDEFVRGGGTLLCFNRSGLFAIDQLHLPVKNVVAGVKRQEFFTGGSILQVLTEVGHPVMAGMPERAAVFVDGSPVFEPGEGFNGQVIARYAPSGSPLQSGYLVGERLLSGKAAAVDVRWGDGHVVLLGFRPQWRGQPFGTFKVIFNSVLTASPGAPAR